MISIQDWLLKNLDYVAQGSSYKFSINDIYNSSTVTITLQTQNIVNAGFTNIHNTVYAWGSVVPMIDCAYDLGTPTLYICV